MEGDLLTSVEEDSLLLSANSSTGSSGSVSSGLEIFPGLDYQKDTSENLDQSTKTKRARGWY
jgi:hypothetical protein